MVKGKQRGEMSSWLVLHLIIWWTWPDRVCSTWRSSDVGSSSRHTQFALIHTCICTQFLQVTTTEDSAYNNQKAPPFCRVSSFVAPPWPSPPRLRRSSFGLLSARRTWSDTLISSYACLLPFNGFWFLCFSIWSFVVGNSE